MKFLALFHIFEYWTIKVKTKHQSHKYRLWKRVL